MVTFVQLEKVAEDEYTFVLKRPAVYRGTITVERFKGADPVIKIEYTEPNPQAVTAQLREELDPFIIEKVIKEVLS